MKLQQLQLVDVLTFTEKSTSPRFTQTPEEHALRESILILEEVLSASTLHTVTRNSLERVKQLINPVLDVVSDYHHTQARIEELESEVDDRDGKISELEERVTELSSIEH